MNDRDQSSRRDFLKGKAAVKALRTIADGNISVPTPLANEHNSVERQNAYLEHYSKNAMACEFALMFNMHQYPQSGPVTAAAFELIDRLEEQMSVYREHSEISLLNASAYSAPQQVESKLYGLLKLAIDINHKTGRAFDITSSELGKVWGFHERQGKVPTESELQEALKTVGTDHLQLDDQHETVKFSNPGTSINLGGIGKGFALDEVCELISSKQVFDFIIHGGQSSVVARGSQVIDESESAPTGWAVGLTHPTIPDQRLAEIKLRNEALGTSGTARQGFYVKGKRYGHIIDPRLGWPTDHLLSTTVISDSAALSDALATAFFVMKIEDIEDYCRQNENVKAIVILNDSNSKQTQLEWFNLSDEDWTRT